MESSLSGTQSSRHTASSFQKTLGGPRRLSGISHRLCRTRFPAFGVQCAKPSGRTASPPPRQTSGSLRQTVSNGKTRQTVSNGKTRQTISNGKSRTTVDGGTGKAKQTVSGGGTAIKTVGSRRGASVKEPPTSALGKASRFYFNVTGYPFPLGPFLERKTIRKEIDPGTLWVFEQEQGLGFSNVSTNVRMTVIKLKSGGLWVHAPIAPTRECVALLKELGLPIEYIVLPTFAYEHKVFMGPFQRAFPQAKAYVAPSQWSWPVNLPVQFFGIFPNGVVEEGQEMPWSDEIDHKCFCSPVGIGPYSEVVFFHKRQRTLLVTDAVIYVPSRPPEVVRDDALLEAGGPLPFAVRAFSGGDDEGDDPPPPPNDAAQKLLGWKRMALQILFFAPFNLLRPDPSFNAVSERLLVSPVVKTLVFGNARDQAREWAETVAADWNFRRVIPCHFAGPVNAGPLEWRAAFAWLSPQEAAPPPKKSFLESLLPSPPPKKPAEFLPQDLRALDAIENALKASGVLYK